MTTDNRLNNGFPVTNPNKNKIKKIALEHIPTEWEKKTDSDGKIYYVDPKTNEIYYTENTGTVTYRRINNTDEKVEVGIRETKETQGKDNKSQTNGNNYKRISLLDDPHENSEEEEEEEEDEEDQKRHELKTSWATLWSCPACTFHNPISLLQCEMCQQLKIPSAKVIISPQTSNYNTPGQILKPGDMPSNMNMTRTKTEKDTTITMKGQKVENNEIEKIVEKKWLEIEKDLRDMKVQIIEWKQDGIIWQGTILEMDDKFFKWKDKQMRRLNDMPNFLTRLLNYSKALEYELQTMTNKMKESECECERINNICNEMQKKKKEMMEEFEKLFSTKIQIIEVSSGLHEELLKHKQSKETSSKKIKKLEEINLYCNELLRDYEEYNETKDIHIQEKEKELNEKWTQLHKKWFEWNAQELSMFIVKHIHNFGLQPYIMNNAQQNNITGRSLSNITITQLTDVLGIPSFQQAIMIFDQLQILIRKYPIPITSTSTTATTSVVDPNSNEPIEVISTPNIEQQIPKEYLCPISKELMTDPVIAMDGMTYDRASIVKYCQNNPNPLSPINTTSLLRNGELKFFINRKLKIEIDRYLSIRTEMQKQN